MIVKQKTLIKQMGVFNFRGASRVALRCATQFVRYFALSVFENR